MYRALVILPGLFLDLNTLMKHLVSLVQPNFQQGPSWLNIFFLPYSVSCVWAFAQSHTDIDAKYKLDKIVWDRRDIDQLAQQLATNRLVLFSTYVWNSNYNYALARKIKKINPDIIHLHHLHGYFVNINILFNFLKSYNGQVVWTFHDCWSFTR